MEKAFHAFQTTYGTTVCQNRCMHKDKNVPLHSWIYRNGNDRFHSGLTYGETEKIMSGIREVVYTNGTHSIVELTKEQKGLIDKLSIEL